MSYSYHAQQNFSDVKFKLFLLSNLILFIANNITSFHKGKKVNCQIKVKRNISNIAVECVGENYWMYLYDFNLVVPQNKTHTNSDNVNKLYLALMKKIHGAEYVRGYKQKLKTENEDGQYIKDTHKNVK